MSEKKTNRENRRRRRRRNQLISYCVMAVVLIAVGIGCFLGIRAAGSAVKQHQAAQEESRQELLEASRVEESAQAQAAVAALFETESTEETESTYTKEDALNDMVEDTLAGMTLEQKVAGLFFVTPEQLTGVSQVVAAGDATRESLEKYPVGGLIYFAQNIQSENQLKEMLSNTTSYSLFPLFFGVDEEGGKVARVADALKLDKTYRWGKSVRQEIRRRHTMHIKISEVIFLLMVFNVDFAPVADVLTNVDNTVIGNRAFSSDAGVAAQMVSSAVTGLQETGVSACLKHFPDTGTQQGILIPARRRRIGRKRRWKQRNFTVSVWHRSGRRYDYGRAYHSTEPDRWRFASCEYFRKKIITECCATNWGIMGLLLPMQ